MRIYANAVEIPYQVVDEGTLVRAVGGVAENETIRWTIRTSLPGSAFASQAWVTDTGTHYEIQNGIVAARIPKVIPCPVPATYADPGVDLRRVVRPSQILAPIQGVRHRDGAWSGTGPNYLYDWQSRDATDALGSWNWPATEPALVEVVENGPLRAKVRVTYSGLRPRYIDPSGNDVDGHYDGWYICTITVEAGQKTIRIEGESNARINWHVNMNVGMNADRGRYKGHRAEPWGPALGGASAIQNGHNYDGTVMAHPSGSGHQEGEFILSEGGIRSGFDWSGMPLDCVYCPELYHWYSWAVNSGVYFYAYNSAGSGSSNVWGIIQGRPTGHFKFSFTGLYGTPATGTPTEHGFYTNAGVELDNADGHQCKYDFSLFFGTKSEDVPVDFSVEAFWGIGEAGLYAVNQSGISRAYSLVTGVAQAWKQLDQGLDFPDPEGGFPGMHLTRADTEALIATLEADQGPGSYYETLYNGDPNYQRIWRAFANADGTESEAISLVQWCVDYLSVGIDVFVNYGSIAVLWWQYWQGTLRFQEIVIPSMAMLSLDQVRPFLSVLQKRQLKAILSVVGHISWDNDFVPWDYEGAGHAQITYGTANMPVQFGMQKNQFVAVLKTHPEFIARFDTALEWCTTVFEASVVASGAPKDSPKYCGTLTVPATDVFRQLQVSGYADVFAVGSSLYNRLVLYGEWILQLATPPQARFGDRRKIVCFGDGSSENTNIQVALIMGFEASNPTLSKRLAWLWVDMGRSVYSFYASTGLKVTPTVLTQDPLLGDADFAGSFTVFRSSWETADESAVWLHHGAANLDHCTLQRGSPALHLLGEPVTISFGALYNPHINGPWVGASTYIPVSELDSTGLYPTLAWDTYTDYNLPCGDHSTYFNDTYTHSFATDRCDLTCTFAVSGWVRQMTYYRDDLACPVVRFRDTDTATGDSICTLHMMATGNVTLPDGSTISFSPATSPMATLVNGSTFSVPNGACFKFIGQWGVSWDVYYFGPAATGMISFFWHNWHPAEESSQFYAETGIYPFEEKQYILRIKTAGPCDTVIVPYRTRPAGLNVTQVSGGPNLNLFTTAGGNRSLPA